MAISEHEIMQIQQATDIVRLIGEQIALKPKGREFLGLCPFHDDNSPSLHVSPVKQIYKCFSCGAGGNVFGFMMNYHKMSFPEALQFLAERAGITIHDNKAEKNNGSGKNLRKQLETANELALKFFQKQLSGSSGEAARKYIEKRNIDSAMVKSFALGFALDSWDGLSKEVLNKNWDKSAFEATGLISKRDSGGFYDKLRGRLILPIFDSLGRPIAFGGRKLNEEDEGPKYLNSPETPLFDKSSTLYGLHLAKKPIIDSKVAVIVEGYTDTIACHQAGFNNVVATLGTAFTTKHARELRRYSEKIILIFDPDQAGQKAAGRAVEIFLSENMDVYIATLPGQLDPADLMNKDNGLQVWQDTLNNAKPALEYQFEVLAQQTTEAQTITGKQNIIDNYLQTLVRSGLNKLEPVKKSFILRRLAQFLDLSQEQLTQLLSSAEPWKKNKENLPAKLALNDSEAKITALGRAELQIIGGLLKNNELFFHCLANGQSIDEAILPAEMSLPKHRELYSIIYEKLTDNGALTLAELLAFLAAQEKHDLADLATKADADLDTLLEQTNDIDLALIEILELAINKIEQYKSRREYLKERDSLLQKDIKQIDKAVREYAIKPNPARIARKKH